jgi:phosphoribosylaminoimidazolecarboxamide formyltransferase/IMP cyclohydrolase
VFNIKTALVSVSDKSNLNVLAEFFKKNQVKVISTGGTSKELERLGVSVTSVESVTGFPEVMDGRVKTLHPNIHMGLLARGDNESDQSLLKEHKVDNIDLVVVNLYPFQEQVKKDISEKEKVEFIDVGGPSMVRAAAKNFNRILLLTDPKDYQVLKKGDDVNLALRKKMSAKAFSLLADYNKAIADWMLGGESETGSELRYGENPHQNSKWTFDQNEDGLHKARIIQGKALSFNNLVDLTAAVESLSVIQGSSGKKTVVSVKHNNPCGVGQSDSLSEAMKLSFSADPMSVFGSVVACNAEVGLKEAEQILDIFIECVVAPSFSTEALKILSIKKNLRLLEWGRLSEGYVPSEDFKRVSGGVLHQDFDLVSEDPEAWELVSGKSEDLTKELKEQLDFANRVVARLKSNAIALVGPSMSLGLGMGQVNRVDSVKLALERWKSFHPDFNGTTVLASDAFFPFSDSIEIIADFGVKWVLQPGGSIKDKDVIAKAKEKGLGMIFTGKRHFLH